MKEYSEEIFMVILVVLLFIMLTLQTSILFAGSILLAYIVGVIISKPIIILIKYLKRIWKRKN